MEQKSSCEWRNVTFFVTENMTGKNAAKKKNETHPCQLRCWAQENGNVSQKKRTVCTKDGRFFFPSKYVTHTRVNDAVGLALEDAAVGVWIYV